MCETLAVHSIISCSWVMAWWIKGTVPFTAVVVSGSCPSNVQSVTFVFIHTIQQDIELSVFKKMLYEYYVVYEIGRVPANGIRRHPADPVRPMPAGFDWHGQQDGHADTHRQTEQNGQRHARPHASVPATARTTGSAFFDLNWPSESARHISFRLVKTLQQCSVTGRHFSWLGDRSSWTSTDKLTDFLLPLFFRPPLFR